MRAVPQRGAVGARRVAHQIHGFRADAAHRQVDDALERGVVGAARNQAQIRQGILDFGALEETQAAVHPIGHARIQERFFENARLRIRAIQHRDLAPRAAARHPFADAIDHEIRLIALVEGGIELDPLAVLAAGPQGFAETARIVGDQAHWRPSGSCRWSGNSVPACRAPPAGKSRRN